MSVEFLGLLGEVLGQPRVSLAPIFGSVGYPLGVIGCVVLLVTSANCSGLVTRFVALNDPVEAELAVVGCEPTNVLLGELAFCLLDLFVELALEMD